MNEAKSDFISISYAPILFFFHFFFTNCANVDSFIWIFAFALKSKKKHPTIRMPFDVSYALDDVLRRTEFLQVEKTKA